MSIVGYTYNTENYCPDDMRDIAIRKARELGDATMWGDCGSPEEIIGTWASLEGIDRYDERTYDSGDFPKVILSTGVHDVCTTSEGYDPGQCGDYCCVCLYPLDDECPNGYTGPRGR